MILAQNHRLPLNGNKHWLVVLLGILLAACSPKVKQAVVAKPVLTVKEEKKVEPPAVKFTQATISLLVPFRLNELSLKTATKADVEKSVMAIDFYQGFKLGVDSAAASGLNFNLKVFDTEDSQSQVNSLIENGSLTGSNLIVGPVFPNGLKYIKNYSIVHKIPIVNPLAATHPEEFNNPNLISVVNNIDLHAGKIADYITKTYQPSNTVVVLINTKSEDDELLAKPIRNYFSNTNKAFVFQEFTSVFSMEMKIVKNKKYVIIVSSSNKSFVTTTLDKLVKMKNAGLNVDLFGHPDWIKQNYNTEKLQSLRTIVSSSYKVDYKRPEVNAFIRKYRVAYSFEPGEYAFKGFDIGFYFAKLLSSYGEDYLQYLTKVKYTGLHNNFSFLQEVNLGYINTSLVLLRYQNFELTKME